jgi:hypothetical protein
MVIRIATLLAWYLLGFAPSIFGGYLYYRQDRSVGKAKAFLLGNVLVLWNYVSFISCWKATLRSLRGMSGWEKTVRGAEDRLDYLLPASARVAASIRATGRLRRQAPEARPVAPPAPPRQPVPAAVAHARVDAPVDAPVMTIRFAPPEHHTTATAPSVVAVRSVARHRDRPATGRSTVSVMVSAAPAMVSGAPATPAARPETGAAPALTGRLQMGRTRRPSQLGDRFLTTSALPDNFATLDGETK